MIDWKAEPTLLEIKIKRQIKMMKCWSNNWKARGAKTFLKINPYSITLINYSLSSQRIKNRMK